MDLLRPPAPRLHLPLMVDVGDDDLDDDDEGDGEEHARRAEDFAAKDDAEDDGDGVEVDGFADEGGIDDVVVDLCEREIEERGLQCDVPCTRGGVISYCSQIKETVVRRHVRLRTTVSFRL